MSEIGADNNRSIFCDFTTDIGSVLFVDLNGDDSTAVKGDINKPWLSPWVAAASSAAGDTIWIWNGTYTRTTETANLISHNNMVIIGNGSTLVNCNTLVADDTSIIYATVKGLSLRDWDDLFIQAQGTNIKWSFEFINVEAVNTANDFIWYRDPGNCTGMLSVKVDNMHKRRYLASFENSASSPSDEFFQVYIHVKNLTHTATLADETSRPILGFFDAKNIRVYLKIDNAEMIQSFWGFLYTSGSNSDNVFVDIHCGYMSMENIQPLGTERGGFFTFEWAGTPNCTIRARFDQLTVTGFSFMEAPLLQNMSLIISDSNILVIDPVAAEAINIVNQSGNITISNSVFTCENKPVIGSQLAALTNIEILSSKIERTGTAGSTIALINNIGTISIFNSQIINNAAFAPITCTVARTVISSGGYSNSAVIDPNVVYINYTQL